MSVFEKVISIVNNTQKQAALDPAQYIFLIDALTELFNKPIPDYNAKFTAIKYVSATEELNLHGAVMTHFLDNFMIPTQHNDTYMSNLVWPLNLLFRSKPNINDCQLYIYADDVIIFVNFAAGDNEFIVIPRNYTTPIASIIN